MNNNIFNFKIEDATAYFVFYVVIPIIVTYISLKVFPSDITSGVYCYVTILVSILNSMYDGAGRWRSGTKSRRNAKIFAIWVCDAIVGVYCLYVIFSVLIMNNMNCRQDWILFTYGGAVSVVLWDMGTSFLQNITLKKEIGGVEA